MIFDNMERYSYNLNTDRLISMIAGLKVPGIPLTGAFAPARGEKEAAVRPGGWGSVQGIRA